jgi:hypothetical protein
VSEAGRVVRARPDGYTIYVGNTGTVFYGALYSLPYDVLNDFEPVALLSAYPHALVARKTMPANDLNGLIAWLRANPDKATAGGVRGGTGHIASLFFQKETGTQFQFVPYRGGTPAMQGQLKTASLDPAPVSASPRTDRLATAIRPSRSAGARTYAFLVAASFPCQLSRSPHSCRAPESHIPSTSWRPAGRSPR